MKKALSYGIRPNNSEFKVKLKCEMYDKFETRLSFFKRFKKKTLMMKSKVGNRYSSLRTLEERAIIGDKSYKMHMESLNLKEESIDTDIPSLFEIRRLIDYSNNHPYN